jgi:ABC-type transport system involved in multi-copper enzyme maturation permease subunit
MPIHDVGYRRLKNENNSSLFRWLAICRIGVQLALKSKWVKRLMLSAWLPVTYWAGGFFFVEKAIMADQLRAMGEGSSFDQFSMLALTESMTNRFWIFPGVNDLQEVFQTGDIPEIRNTAWRWMLMTFFRYPQAIIILFLVGFIAPSLISQDIRSRALLLYFSRPISRFEYIWGKLCVPSIFIILVTTLPALCLYSIALLMSPDISTLPQTWDIPVRIIIATFGLVLPTSAVALMLSSLTQETRFANFSWFAIWGLGHGAWLTIALATSLQMGRPLFDPAVMQSDIVTNWSAISLYNSLGSLQSYIFGFSTFTESWRGIISLFGITAFSMTILYRRVSSPV